MGAVGERPGRARSCCESQTHEDLGTGAYQIRGKALEFCKDETYILVRALGKV